MSSQEIVAQKVDLEFPKLSSNALQVLESRYLKKNEKGELWNLPATCSEEWQGQWPRQS